LSAGTDGAATSARNLSDGVRWCVALTNAEGKDKTYSYSAEHGLQTGDCA
jgi:hypothetical protein